MVQIQTVAGRLRLNGRVIKRENDAEQVWIAAKGHFTPFLETELPFASTIEVTGTVSRFHFNQSKELDLVLAVRKDDPIITSGEILAHYTLFEADEYLLKETLLKQPKIGEKTVDDLLQKLPPNRFVQAIDRVVFENNPAAELVEAYQLSLRQAKAALEVYDELTTEAFQEKCLFLNACIEKGWVNFNTSKTVFDFHKASVSDWIHYFEQARKQSDVYVWRAEHKKELFDYLLTHPYSFALTLGGNKKTLQKRLLMSDVIACSQGFSSVDVNRIAAYYWTIVKGETDMTSDTYIDYDERLRLELLQLLSEHTVSVSPQWMDSFDQTQLDASPFEDDARMCVVYDEGTLSCRTDYQYTEVIAEELFKRLETSKPTIASDLFEDLMIAAQENQQMVLADGQKEALRQMNESPFFVLTGGPGTGKTSLLRIYLQLLAQYFGLNWLRDPDYVQALALTGKAAKRMTNQMSFSFQESEIKPWIQAQTLHSFLFQKALMPDIIDYQDANFRVCLVDEASMMDEQLFCDLLKKLDPRAKLILIGDGDQLASIGKGRVLKDLIESPYVPSYQLTEIFRSAGVVAENAQVMAQSTVNMANMQWVPGTYVQLNYPSLSQDLATKRLEEDQLCQTFANMYLSVDRDKWIDTYLFMTPKRRAKSQGTTFVTETMNRKISQVLQPINQSPYLSPLEKNLSYDALLKKINDRASFKSMRCRVSANTYSLIQINDMVINLSNMKTPLLLDAELDEVASHRCETIEKLVDLDLAAYHESFVVNGEVGFVTHILHDGSIFVKYEGIDKQVVYSKHEAALKLDLAYVITVHKAQGSEAENVCLVLTHEGYTGPYAMNTKESIYTALTRAKKRVAIYSDYSVLNDGLHLISGNRKTRLVDCLEFARSRESS